MSFRVAIIRATLTTLSLDDAEYAAVTMQCLMHHYTSLIELV